MTVTDIRPEAPEAPSADAGLAAAEAARIRAEADKQEIANRRAAMKLEAEQAGHERRLAEERAKKAAADAAARKALAEAAVQEKREADRTAEQQRTEAVWKWGARGIYAVGLAIAAPVQFLDFWDRKRPFLVVAPVLLEGLALVLAFGAAWAVAHRRDVAPYRIGIMIGAMIAAGINMRGGLTNPAIGLNAGIIGAIASLGGPIVLMAYEHGIAQKADGIPSWRETRAATKEKAAADAAREKAKAERKAAEEAAAAAKEDAAKRAEAEQKRKDADREQGHAQVWAVAEAMRSARGSQFVTEQIWADAWYRVTGSKTVGITAEIEALSREAQARMKAASEGASPQVESQMPTAERRAPDAVDARRFNGGTPPRRQPGDSTPYSPAARRAMADTARSVTATGEVDDS
jgi:hypothetical protein